MKKTLNYINVNGCIMSYDIYGQDEHEINKNISTFFELHPRCRYLSATY